MALRYISGVAVDSEVVVHLSTVPQYLLVVDLYLRAFRLWHEGAQLEPTKPFLNAGESLCIPCIPFSSSIISVIDVAMHTLQIFLCCSLSTNYESLDLIKLCIDMSTWLAVLVGDGGCSVLNICCSPLQEWCTSGLLAL